MMVFTVNAVPLHCPTRSWRVLTHKEEKSRQGTLIKPPPQLQQAGGSIQIESVSPGTSYGLTVMKSVTGGSQDTHSSALCSSVESSVSVLVGRVVLISTCSDIMIRFS